MMDRLQIANKIEADARQFYKRYTAGLELSDDDLRMLIGFGVHLHNNSADQSRVIAVLTEALDGAIDGLTNLGRCPDHPCLFCNAITMTNRDNLTEALAEANRIQEGK